MMSEKDWRVQNHLKTTNSVVLVGCTLIHKPNDSYENS